MKKKDFENSMKGLLNVPPPDKAKRHKKHEMNRTQIEDIIGWSEILDSRYNVEIVNAQREGKLPKDFKIGTMLTDEGDDITLQLNYITILPLSLFQELLDGIHVIRKRQE